MGEFLLLKIVNFSEKQNLVSIYLGDINLVNINAKLILLTSEKHDDLNSFINPTRVSPVTKTIELTTNNFEMDLLPFSLSVVRIKIKL